MKMAVMDVVQMALMFDGRVPAVGTVNVRVGLARQMRFIGGCRGVLGVPCAHSPIVAWLGRARWSLRVVHGSIVT